MMIDFFRYVMNRHQPGEDRAMDAEFEPVREELERAGLDEEALRKMDPDERVAVLEQAKLDPYDYIYLAC